MALLNKIINYSIVNSLKLNVPRQCMLFSSSDSLPPSGGNYPSEPTIYDCRKYGHNLPEGVTFQPEFELLGDMPSGVFRCTAGEVLGPCAGKYCFYKNPEYFSYQHMSFFDFHLFMRNYRLPSPDLKRKPP